MNDISFSTPEEALKLYELLIDQMGLVIVMDTQSRFLLANNLTARTIGYPNGESTRGITPHDMRCPAAECADELIIQDRHVMENRTNLNLLDIHTYADQGRKILLTRKSPLIINDKVEGLIISATELKNDTLQKISSLLLASDNRYFSKREDNGRSYIISDLCSSNTLTRRELDCLFYLLRGFSMKEIARFLDISWRTVETYLNKIKLKWGCNNRSQVIEYAVAHGFLNYIPKELLPPNLCQTISEE